MKHYGTIADLPAVLPVFPLAGALLLPRVDLPLNIFEPRYLAMFNDAMAGERLIGMIQPVSEESAEGPPRLAKVGCVGRITTFSETEDGRILVNLSGVCRFAAADEIASAPYRRLKADYGAFSADLKAGAGASQVDRASVMAAFRQYLTANNLTANWEEVEQVSAETLVNTLCQMAPYPPQEKQALLEAADLKARAEMLVALTELALARGADAAGRTLQ